MTRYTLLAVALALVVGLGLNAQADEDVRLFDRQLMRVVDGTADIDTSAADYTGWVNLIEILPNDNNALQDVRIVIDLDKATTGFADASGYDTETIQISIARKVDGTNYRTATNLAVPATAIAADDADGLSIEIDIGEVGPTEDLQIRVKLSAEAAADVELPFILYYRSGSAATVTPVAAG